MKFVVTRASDLLGNKKPCKNAKKELINYKNGSDEEWTIEINTLEELINFSKEVGNNLVLSVDDNLELTIYDSYLE